LCAQADIAVTVNEIPTLAAAGHCLEAYDGVEAGSAAISLPLATQTPPGQFGPSFMDVQSAGAGGSNAEPVTIHRQSSATQDAGSIGTTADYEARAWFGGGFLIQNTAVTTAEVTQSGFASNSPSSQQQFGLFGGGNTECFVSSCSIMVGDALLGTLLVSPESTASIVAIQNIRTQATVADSATYSVLAADSHVVTIASTSPDVVITPVPEADGAVLATASVAAFVLAAWRRSGRGES
jgi:hypothetical protein